MWMRLLAAIGLVGILGIGSPSKATEPRFRLTVLTQDWMDLGEPQTWEEAQSRLKEASGAPFFTLDERDVAAYDWQAQRIVLRPEVSLRVLAAAQKLPGAEGEMLKLKALWRTSDLWEAVEKHGFVVSLDGEPVYGGIFLRKESELAIDYPVIHSALDEHRRIVLRFAPIHFASGSLWDDGSGDALETLRNPSSREVFRDAKERLGPADWHRINSFKQRIQDPRIQAVFNALKTPAQAPPVPRVERPAPAQPVRVGVTPYSRDPSVSLYFSRPDTVSEVRCRLAGKGESSDWVVALYSGQAPLGSLSPGRYEVEVEALDWAGELAGRYSFSFDTEQEALAEAKELIESSNSWAHFYDYEKGVSSGLYFNGPLNSWGDVLREIRYSLDDCSLDRRFPASFRDSEGKEKLYEPVPPETAFTCVQLIYQDGEASPVRRFYHDYIDPDPEPAAPAAADLAPPAGPRPVDLKVHRSDDSWDLYLSLEKHLSVREIRYRFGTDPEWHRARSGRQVDLITGERFPDPSLLLTQDQVRLGRHRLEVKLKDWNGVESGPYVFWFDPEAEIVKAGKANILAAGSDWVEFNDQYDLIRFDVYSWRDSLREVRYSFDGCALDRRYPFRVWTRLNEVSKGHEDFFVRNVKDVQSVCVQLVFRDGEVTEPRQYFRNSPPARAGSGG